MKKVAIASLVALTLFGASSCKKTTFSRGEDFHMRVLANLDEESLLHSFQSDGRFAYEISGQQLVVEYTKDFCSIRVSQEGPDMYYSYMKKDDDCDGTFDHWEYWRGHPRGISSTVYIDSLESSLGIRIITRKQNDSLISKEKTVFITGYTDAQYIVETINRKTGEITRTDEYRPVNFKKDFQIDSLLEKKILEF